MRAHPLNLLIAVLAGTCFVIGLALQIVFCFGLFSQTTYIVTTGVARH